MRRQQWTAGREVLQVQVSVTADHLCARRRRLAECAARWSHAGTGNRLHSRGDPQPDRGDRQGAGRPAGSRGPTGKATSGEQRTGRRRTRRPSRGPRWGCGRGVQSSSLALHGSEGDASGDCSHRGGATRLGSTCRAATSPIPTFPLRPLYVAFFGCTATSLLIRAYFDYRGSPERFVVRVSDSAISGQQHWWWGQGSGDYRQTILLSNLDRARSRKRGPIDRILGRQYLYSKSGDRIYLQRWGFSRADLRGLLDLVRVDPVRQS